MSEKLAVGIDLGTTHSSLATCDSEGNIGLIKSPGGKTLTPSVVGLSDDKSLIIGSAAYARRILHPDTTIAAFKRHMGTEKTYQLGKQSYDSAQLSSLVLRKLHEDFKAAQQEERALGALVISVPAYFNSVQREATMLAAELAGLPRPHLINEPTAAALAYGLHDRGIEQTIVVLDLGGGTFDVSIVEMFEGVMEVRASSGDTMLGGEDFTKIIAYEICRHAQKSWKEIDRETRSKVLSAAESVKRHLSSATNAEIEIKIDGEDHLFRLSRDKFEELSAELLLRMRRPIEQSLYDAKLDVADVERIVLVGGATRMPMIRGLAARILRKLPESGLDPDEVVARGAAVQAGLLQKNAALSDLVMTDVAPFSLGIRSNIETAHGDIPDGFAPIIERNTILPASRVSYFYTLHDNQRKIAIEVYQGEAPIARENVRIGETEVEVPPAGKGREGIAVRFSYDTSGLLHVEVTVISTEQKTELVIEGNARSLSEREKKQRLKALDAYKVHPRELEENLELLEKIKALYAMMLGDDRQHISDLLAIFEKALAGQDPREIERVKEKLEKEVENLENNYVR